MNLLAVVLGSIIVNTLAFILGARSYHATVTASLLGISGGHAAAWIINKLARRELKSVRFAVLSPIPSPTPHMIDQVEQDGKSYFRIHTVGKKGEIIEDLLPIEQVSIHAASIASDPVICERRLCIKNKFSAMLALCKMEFVDYQVIVPFDKLP